MLSDINTVKILYYLPRDIDITLPTHYNKHSRIFNSYKYDISGMVFHFLQYKIKSGELKFIVNDEINEIIIMQYLNTVDAIRKKKLYTKLSGLIVKINRQFYTEFLHSSISVIESLLRQNQKMGVEFNILKVFVDEVIVDKPLLFKNVQNDYSYNFNETYFRLFVKSLPFLKKQLYITDSEIELAHNFVSENNLITDLEQILDSGLSLDSFHTLTSNIINGAYDAQKLIQYNNATNKKFIKSQDNVEVPIEFIPEFNKFKYNLEYYYKIYQDVGSNLIYVKGL